MSDAPPRPRIRPVEWVMASASLIGALGMLSTGALWLTGTWAAPIELRLQQFSHQMEQFQQRIDTLPRRDQLDATDGHAHALDGRMDGTDTRLRLDELDIATLKQKVQSIEDNSRVGLGATRR